MTFKEWWYDFTVKNGQKGKARNIAEAAWAASRIDVIKDAPAPSGPLPQDSKIRGYLEHAVGMVTLDDRCDECREIKRFLLENVRSGPLRSESGESFLGENDYREALLLLTGLFDDEGKFSELHQDQASVALETARAMLDGKRVATERAG